MSEFKPEFTCITALEITGQIIKRTPDGQVFDVKSIKESFTLTNMEKAHGLIDALRKAWEQEEVLAGEQFAKSQREAELEAELAELKAQLQEKEVQTLKETPLTIEEFNQVEVVSCANKKK